MTTLQDTFVVLDFGGQPEYYPWHKLFLTTGALYVVVVDLADDSNPTAREDATRQAATSQREWLTVTPAVPRLSMSSS